MFGHAVAAVVVVVVGGSAGRQKRRLAEHVAAAAAVVVVGHQVHPQRQRHSQGVPAEDRTDQHRSSPSFAS